MKPRAQYRQTNRDHRNPEPESDRGRAAEKPTHIPKKGWRDILLRTKQQMTKDHLSIVAGGVAFFLLLGMVPTLTAAISIYGLMADPSQISRHFESVSTFLPEAARDMMQQQITRISSQTNVAGWGAALSILLALWGASKATKSLIQGMNVAYDEVERRGTIKLSLLAIGLALFLIVIGFLAIGMIVAIPIALGFVGLGSWAETLMSVLRWPLLLGVAMFALAVLYRYAPCRDKAQWRWISPGTVLATLLWIAASALFAFYVSNFGSYNKTYGSLAAVVVTMLWLYISAYVALLGAELNAEIEHQTRKDTTEGKPRPMGHRSAYVADTEGETP